MKEGLKVPKACPFDCIKTCDVTHSPYCIMLALYNAFKGKLRNGYAFCGSNAWRAEKIQSVRELMTSLRTEYDSFAAKCEGFSLREKLFGAKWIRRLPIKTNPSRPFGREGFVFAGCRASFRRGVDEFEFGELRVFLVGDLDAVTQVLPGVDQYVGPCAVVAVIERILRFRIVGAEQVEADVVLLARGQVVNLRKNFAGDGREFDVCA